MNAYKDWFPPPEESGSRFPAQRRWRTEDPKAEKWNEHDGRFDGLPEESAKVATWRRLLLSDMVRGMKVHDMSPLLLDQAIDKILTASHEEILRYFSLLKEDGWGR